MTLNDRCDPSEPSGWGQVVLALLAVTLLTLVFFAIEWRMGA